MGLRTETEQKLVALSKGEITPEAAAEWALAMMEGDDEALRDESVWNALDNLGGADLLTEPGVYLHGSEDFHEWLKNYRDAQSGRKSV